MQNKNVQSFRFLSRNIWDKFGDCYFTLYS